MASLTPGTRVELRGAERDKLRNPPPPGVPLYVSVHPGALKAPKNTLTQTAALDGNQVVWCGAVDEQMLDTTKHPARADARLRVARDLLAGPLLWHVWRPGLLTRPGVPTPLYTVYDGDRPWVIIGELANGRVLAAPLNDARGNPRSYTPVIAKSDLPFAGSKESQLELAHLWSWPRPSCPQVQVQIGTAAQHCVRAAVLAQY